MTAERPPTVLLRRRFKPGETVTVELLPAAPGRPQIVLDFKVPERLEYAECEAIAQTNLGLILKTPSILARYGFDGKSLSEDEAMGLRDKVFLIEAAVRFWIWTNAALEGHEPGKLTPEFIAEMIHDPFISAAWHLHITNAMALDASEGNGSGASLDTSSGEAPTSAEDATRPAPDAPEGSPPGTASSDVTADDSSTAPTPAPDA
jgi:hypothetical protein